MSDSDNWFDAAAANIQNQVNAELDDAGIDAEVTVTTEPPFATGEEATPDEEADTSVGASPLDVDHEPALEELAVTVDVVDEGAEGKRVMREIRTHENRTQDRKINEMELAIHPVLRSSMSVKGFARKDAGFRITIDVARIDSQAAAALNYFCNHPGELCLFSSEDRDIVLNKDLRTW